MTYQTHTLKQDELTRLEALLADVEYISDAVMADAVYKITGRRIARTNPTIENLGRAFRAARR